MKDPSWIAALFAVLGLFLGIGWLFMAMTAIFVALIAAGSVDKHASSHAHDSHAHDSHGHGHDSHGAHTHGHNAHAEVHVEQKPLGGFLDIFLGQAIYNKRFNKPAEAKEAEKPKTPIHAHAHEHEHEHDPRPTMLKGQEFHDPHAGEDWRYKAFNRETKEGGGGGGHH